jgi:hypothetical protein
VVLRVYCCASLDDLRGMIPWLRLADSSFRVFNNKRLGWNIVGKEPLR